MPLKTSVDTRDLKAALAQLSKATARGVQQRVLLKHAQPIVELAKAKAPVGKTGTLKASIRATTKRPRGYKSPAARAFASTLRTTGSIARAKAAAKAAGSAPVEVFVGNGPEAWYAHFVEFGTVKATPRPFMRASFDQLKGSVFTGVKDDLWAEIQKTVARIAKRKAAKSR